MAVMSPDTFNGKEQTKTGKEEQRHRHEEETSYQQC